MNLKEFSLIDKTALITGSAGLLGIEHAIALLDCGGRVIMTDLNKTKLDEVAKTLGKKYGNEKIIAMEMDVSSEKSVLNVMGGLKSLNIRVDILLNNAAIDPKVKSDNELIEGSRLEVFDYEQWNKEIAVGLTGAFICSKIFGSEMARDSLGGNIVNVASDLSIISPDQRLYRNNDLPENRQPVKPITYSVIKSGLIGLTRYLSTYWVEFGIRCNALSPGGVLNGQSDDFVRNIIERIPMHRMANPNEYRSAIQFLCSDASKYMNGHNLIIDGGRSVW